MCTAFFFCCCHRNLLGCLAPHWSAWSSLLSAQLLLSLRNRSFTTGARTGTRTGGVRWRSGGCGKSAASPQNHAARQVPAQRGVARLFARVASRPRGAPTGAHAAEPRPVSHVNAGARRNSRHHSAPRMRTASRHSALAGTSVAAYLYRSQFEPIESGRWAQSACEDLLRVATPWSALIKRRWTRCSCRTSGSRSRERGSGRAGGPRPRAGSARPGAGERKGQSRTGRPVVGVRSGPSGPGCRVGERGRRLGPAAFARLAPALRSGTREPGSWDDIGRRAYSSYFCLSTSSHCRLYCDLAVCNVFPHYRVPPEDRTPAFFISVSPTGPATGLNKCCINEWKGVRAVPGVRLLLVGSQ